MTMTRATLLGGAAALAASATAVGTATAADVTQIKFITTLADDMRPFLYAQSVGWFKEANLDIEFQNVATGAVVAQQIVGGAADIGKASITSIIAAYARGLAFAVIAPGLSYRKEDPTAGYLVLANSPLKTPNDLQGKTVSCSAIGDIAYLGLRALIDSHGGDSSTVKFVELPFPAVSAALVAGRIDAGLMGEPAMMEDVRAGKLRYFVDELTGYSRPILEVVYFCTRDYATKNKDAVNRFQKVILRAAAYANTHVAETVPAPAAADEDGSEGSHGYAPRLQRDHVRSERDSARHRSHGEIQKHSEGLRRERARRVRPEAIMPDQPEHVPKWASTLPKLWEIAMGLLFGEMWERPQLSKRDRSLVTCAVLTALYRPDQLRYHIGFALDNGVTKDELAEMMTHVAFYAGHPCAVAAGNIAYDVYEARKTA